MLRRADWAYKTGGLARPHHFCMTLGGDSHSVNDNFVRSKRSTLSLEVPALTTVKTDSSLRQPFVGRPKCKWTRVVADSIWHMDGNHWSPIV